MLHVFFRAATVVLLAVIAGLLYNNYFRSSSSADCTAEHAALDLPPELPRLAPAPDLPGCPIADPAHSEMAANAQNGSGARASKQSREQNLPLAEIIDARPLHDNGPLAEVVELPPRTARRATGMMAARMDFERPNFVAQTKVEEKRSHTVKPGESLWVISKKYYGTGELFTKVAEANHIANNGRIRAGQVLVIPDANAPVASTPVPEEIADHEDAARLVPASYSRDINSRRK